MEDKTIIRLLRRHDEKGMEQLLDQYGKLLRYVIGGILKNRQDAEDCYNEVCLSLWDKADAFQDCIASLSTWLTIIARNAALNKYKANKRREAHLDDGDNREYADESSPETAALSNERQRQIQEAIQTLSLKDRLLIYRKYFYLQSTAQIAVEMGMTERAVEGRLYRLRKRLQKLLGGDRL